MKRLPTANIRYAVLCDDVRREDNGKMMVIGIFGTDILLSQPVPNFMLTLALFIDVVEGGMFTLDITVMSDGERTAGAKANIELGIGRNGVFSIPIPISAKKSSTVSIDIAVNGGKAKRVIEMPVKIAQPSPGSSASPQPS